ncbi:bacteriocin immunity protein [Enterococcus faecium]|uniref:bacteriocin immunity protein n=1 Tax=Enterococcus faecium TaxID=1352 RepID=UPI000C763E92|nr:Enterocin A Immunity [Enterococcus faecium]AUI19537.1 Enterocin A Immunity [Enterococcus faecium]AUI22505.1 Enterocin A Immunity [Enterococcus faecium]AUI25477.1 Enterocin A Immunity [Enterococcus faecium]AUI28451.1 Enterocin A Immunity [Enterococcus faecium]
MCCGNSILQKGLPFFYLHKIFYTLSDILEVLQKVYLKLEKQKYELDPGPLINRLVNYLYFTAYTNKIRFTEYQEELIRNLSEIGRTAGINGLYRADYGDKSQF